MGVYDEYMGLQLKVGPCQLTQYDIGDKVPIEDGVYVAWGGIIVIKDNIFVAVFEHLLSKWGNVIEPEDVLAPHNYVAAAIDGDNVEITKEKRRNKCSRKKMLICCWMH